MNEDQIKDFEKSPEMNLAIADPDIGRFRVNIFKQRGEVAIVARNIKTEIPSAASLGLPPILNDLIMQKNGIVLFVGGTGSGKSTSLAALIDHRNKNSDGHIITIEDPIEFIHHHQKSIINQREVGVDTNSHEEALQNTLRRRQTQFLSERFAVRKRWNMHSHSQKQAIFACRHYTRIMRARLWTASLTSSLKSGTNNYF